MSAPLKPSSPDATPLRVPSGRGGRPLREPGATSTSLEPTRKRILDSAIAEASTNAAAVEWGVFRSECLELAQKPMTLAETGARLLKASSRSTGVLAGGDEAFPFTSFAGVCGSSRVTPDLLPLPVPQCSPATAEDLARLYPPGAAVTVEGFKHGAKAWLNMVLYALNQNVYRFCSPSGGTSYRGSATCHRTALRGLR